jgi:hypothetical protein
MNLASRTALLALAAALSLAAPARSQQPATAPADSAAELSGRVFSATTGDVVRGAQILVEGTGRGALSDSAGRFRIAGLPAGDRIIEVRRIGFASARGKIHLKGGASVDATFVLEDTVVEVQGIRVTVRRDLASAFGDKLERVGYFRRKLRGLGVFLDPARVRERVQESRETSDLLRNLPGVSVSRTILGHSDVRLSRGESSCSPVLYVDGKQSPGLQMDDLNREDVLAIEVYRGASETPLAYSMQKSGCGVILIWTKEGGGRP